MLLSEVMADLEKEFEAMNLDDRLKFVHNQLGGKKVEIDAVYLNRLIFIAIIAHDYIHQPFWYKDRCLEILKDRLEKLKEPKNESSNTHRKTGQRTGRQKWCRKIFSCYKQN